MTEPLILKSICKDYIWGGSRLKNEFGKESESERIAESWELVCHKDGSSIIMNGSDKGLDLKEYIEKYGTGFLGTNCKDCDTIPVLIKLIDAKDKLSIQVHPDDEYAMRNEGEPGKTEMWYIIDAEPGASIYYGVNRNISKEEFAERIKNETLTEVLNKVKVRAGELYFIPSGTIHAIGAGVLIAEIQQNSNTTYRVYDYGRRDKNGNLRELHINKALDVADLKITQLAVRYPEYKVTGGTIRKLEHCRYFASDIVKVKSEVNFNVSEISFNHILVISGSGKLKVSDSEYELKKGSSMLLPVSIGKYSVIGECEFILTYISEKFSTI